MRLYLTRRCLVRIISYALAFCLVFGGSIVYNSVRFKKVQRQLIYRYQSAMEDLSSEMENMSLTLGKAVYTGTPSGLSALTSELILQAGTASAALSALPTNHQELEKISKFLSQVSDYTLTLSRKSINGGDVSVEERSNLKKLANTAKKLSVSLDEAKTLYNNGQSWQESINAALDDEGSVSGIDSSLTSAEETLSDYPTLIYDGPFSDHILLKESQLLKASGEISQKEGALKAAKALNISVESIVSVGEEVGKTPSYLFEFDGGTIAVTKRGGYILYLRNERNINTSTLTYEQAVKKAAEYLANMEMGEFATSYYLVEEGVCTVNFAYRQGDVVCYTDLIKVGVALDNGEVVFYESAGYIMNHRGRTLKVPKFTAAEAEEVISPYLKVKGIELTLIPSGGMKELYCYEFYCTGEDGEEILVYVNTETLAEERLLILLKTDGGTVTK